MKTKLKTEKETRVGNGNQSNREFIGFFVDGKSLRKVLNTENITGIGWGTVEEQRKYIGQLLKRTDSELASKRVPLYVCAECGDLGCGAFTVEIKKENGMIRWSNFGYENNYEDDVKCLVEYSKVGPFEFDEEDYTQLLERFL
jgi:hypothetical protein